MNKKKIIHFFKGIYIRLREKTYKSNKTRCKYLLYDDREADSLIVGLQSCANPPVYNYVRSLSKTKAVRLYIKDDFAKDHRGSYYLGEKAMGNVEPTVVELVSKVRDKIISRHGDIKNIIFIGSSKGGYSAINFATMFKGANAVVAAPQYLLGNYLNCDIMRDQLIDIVGDNSPENIQYLNNRLRNKIFNEGKKNKPIIYIHYSDEEHTYEEHIKYLIEDLKKAEIKVYEDIGHYPEHSDLYKFFPEYLVKMIKEILYE